VLPVARVRLEGALGVGVEAEERARQRIAEACALKRKLSVIRTAVGVELSFCEGSRMGIETMKPWSTRS